MNSMPLKLFTGTANRPLAEAVAQHLRIPLGDAMVTRFSDNEVRVKYNENVRGCHVVILQPMDPRDGNYFMELKLLAYDARGSSAGQLTGVLPYFGYARQDRKDQPRVPISARLVAEELQGAGFKNLMLFDLHAPQLQGFFDPKCTVVDHLFARQTLVKTIRDNLHLDAEAPEKNEHVRLVAPDAGASKIVQAYAERLKVKMDIFQKVRADAGKIGYSRLVGEVEGKTCVLVDDTVDTATTLTKAAAVLMEQGATRVLAVAVHPILSGQAQSLIEQSPIERLFVTDTIQLPKERTTDKIEVVTLAPFIAEAIKRNHEGDSISVMLD